MSELKNLGNHFLAALSPEDSEILGPHLAPVQLELGTCLHRQMETISQVYFVDSGVISYVVAMSDGTGVEAGMMGVNGIIGGGSALDGQLALSEAIVQVAGSARRIETTVLKRAADRSEPLRSMLFRSEQVSTALAQQVAACNALHELEPRLARWLLMLRDLSGTDTLLLKQEFLAQMLGVQRTSVSLVARHLQTVGLIRYRRGHIDLLDVEGLNDTACECYATINLYYKRLIGWEAMTSTASGDH
ncbi:MAG: Crp/Fnr family transcriptional regulator [Xanthobacteraceae bacterium]